ncbi:MAG: DUF885 domain-containing protein [Pseudomonadota bacterium]
MNILYLPRSLVLAFSLALPASTGQTQTMQGGAEQHQSLRQLSDDYWQFFQHENPEAATSYGEYQYNDRLRDLSLAHLKETEDEAETLLARLKKIDVQGLSEADQLDRAILLETLTDFLESRQFKEYLMPMNQLNGIHLQLANLVTIAPFDSVRHYEDYIARLNQVPRLFDQLIVLLKAGVDSGLMPPRYLLEKVVGQIKELQQAPAKRSVFASPLKQFPKEFSSMEKQRLSKAMLSVIETKVRPAYLQLQTYIAKDYAPKGRNEFGVWSLPDGDARYRFAVHTQTTSNLTAEEIHQLGLAQVAELEAQIDALAKNAGYTDGKSFAKKMHAHPSNIPHSRQQILDDYRRYTDAMRRKIPTLFRLLPKAEVIVTSVPAFMEKEASTQYQQATADGKRPGQIWVNTYDPTHQDTVYNEATAYHEGIPGHHMQISIAQELPDTHPFHRSLTDKYNAYVEGWALYSERLGEEVGFYQNTASDLGRLESDLFRAIRLVVDTGVHYKRWSRQQMIDYFVAHLNDPMLSEVDRYIADPGQALGYKIGQLKILELRERAQKVLGAKFDIRSFHDAILNGGALPLNLLEQRMDTWMEQNAPRQ